MTTIKINILEELDQYDRIIDNVTVYGEEWDENGEVILLVDTEEYEQFIAEDNM